MTKLTQPNESRMSHLAARAPRVLVIALDGATYDVLTPLAEQGVMPNLRHFMRQAALVELRSAEPAVTPVAWTTFQTGCDPGAHGIFDYRYLDHRHRLLRLNHAGRIRRATMFDALAAEGSEVVSLNLPMTYAPASPVSGIVVGGLDSPSAQAALAAAPAFAEKLKATGARYELATIWRRKPATFEELDAGIARTQDVFRARGVAARLADEMTDWRLMVVQFQSLDSFQHRLWHLLGVGDGPGGPARWVARCRQALMTLDACVGELFELAQRRQAAVVIVSDHGFGPFRERIMLPELLRRRGLLTESRGAQRARYRMARVGWKLQKSIWRRMWRDRSTAVLDRPPQALLPIDWRKSAAVTLHGTLGALVYLNTPERFGRGPVNSPRLYDQTAAEVVAALREARHPETDEPLFESAYLSRDRYGGDPLEGGWPDVVGIPTPGFHTRSRLDRSGHLLRPDPEMAATHRRDGVLMIGPPAVPLGKRASADLRDVAPTILEMLGAAPLSGAEGRVLRELFPLVEKGAIKRPPAVAACAVPPVVPSEAPLAHNSATPPLPADQRSVEKRLRELGYLE